MNSFCVFFPLTFRLKSDKRGLSEISPFTARLSELVLDKGYCYSSFSEAPYYVADIYRLAALVEFDT